VPAAGSSGGGALSPASTVSSDAFQIDPRGALAKALASLRARAEAAAAASPAQHSAPGRGVDRSASRSFRGRPGLRFCAVLAGLLAPLVAYCSVYAGTYLWRSGILADAASYRSEVLWLRELELFAARIAATERFYMQCGDPIKSSSLSAAINSAMSDLQWIQSAVLNGDAHLGTRATVKVSPEMLTLW
jgi:hypothetical protein